MATIEIYMFNPCGQINLTNVFVLILSEPRLYFDHFRFIISRRFGSNGSLIFNKNVYVRHEECHKTIC